MKLVRKFMTLQLLFILLFAFPNAGSVRITSINPDQTEVPDSININGNQDLIAQARRYGWDLGGSQDGTANYPFQIQDLYLTYNGNSSVYIENTSLYLNLNNVTVDGDNLLTMGITLNNVKHVSIIRSSIINLPSYGQLMMFTNSFDTRIIASNFAATGGSALKGIVSNLSNYTMIYSNQFTGIDNPVSLIQSHYSSVTGNFFYDNVYADISIYNGEHITLQSNFHNNSEIAIEMQYGNLNFIRYNTLNNSRSDAIKVFSSTENSRIIGNTILNSLTRGINLIQSIHTVIALNHIEKNTLYGISLGLDTISNQIKWNNLVDNNNESIQLLDDGASNVILYNHFDDHVGYDTNEDNYEDSVYPVAGLSSNSDPYPLSVPHQTEIALITSPVRTSRFTSNGVITWTPFFSNYLDDSSYNVFYRKYLTTQWILIASNVIDTTLTWDVSSLEDDKYEIRVSTTFNGTLSTSDSSREFFVRNQHMSSIRLFRPNGDQVIDSLYEIRWSHSVDLDAHEVHYSVYLTPNDGANWDLIGSQIVAYYMTFDFRTVEFGNLYRIRVVADDGFGTTVSDDSDNVFTAGIEPELSTSALGSDASSQSDNPNITDHTDNGDTSDSSTNPDLPIPFTGFYSSLFIILGLIYFKRKTTFN